jgi:hypothetical protein
VVSASIGRKHQLYNFYLAKPLLQINIQYLLCKKLQKKLKAHFYTPTLTSNWVSRIFWFGLATGKIQKNAKLFLKLSGLKEAKTAALQLRSPTGCGGEYLNYLGI